MVAHRYLALAVLCLAAFVVNVDTTLVNVALPTLSRELSADTTSLQWIVDAYLLVFAALVLAAGALSDRIGRRRVLIFGLVIFAVGNGLSALSTTVDQLIAARAVTGLGAAAIFPSTLSLITSIFTERRARAAAIGVWGAVTGLAVAAGPIAGGLLLEWYSWGATFLIKVPVALFAIVVVLVVVPEVKAQAQGRFDVIGLVLGSSALAVLVYTIIEAPVHGWTSARTVGGFAAALILGASFIAAERRAADPLLDVAMFRDRRFTAASASITVAFFALFGFIFLVTQYFQLLRGYSPLEAGVRVLPVAICVALGSLIGTSLVTRVGNKLVVTAGLLMLALAYGWISTVSVATSYTEIVGQMVLLGLGMGLTSAPATESVMGAVSDDRAGVGSAVNDAAREVGGTLGVAVIGSIFASLYVASINLVDAPEELLSVARQSVGAALATSAQVPEPLSSALRDAATAGFLDGMQAGCLVAAAIALAAAVGTAIALPSRPSQPEVGVESAHSRLDSAS
jgi:EmrB/QacA subfamily drug resistance transporter